MLKRFALFVVALTPALVVYTGWLYANHPKLATGVSITAVNGGDAEGAAMHTYTAASTAPDIAIVAYVVLLGILCFGGTGAHAIANLRRSGTVAVMIALVMQLAMSGLSK